MLQTLGCQPSVILFTAPEWLKMACIVMSVEHFLISIASEF
jgi:hypothetical protein